MPKLVIPILMLLLACSSGTESPARSRYNHGIDLMAEGDLDRAETAFLDARNQARGDQRVRYAAAFNLGMLHARKAIDLEIAEPQKALDELTQARQWFQDAARVRSDDEDARANLQIVARRMQVLADQLNKGQKSLEARLDRVIEDERALRDQIRALMEEVERAGAESDPVGFRDAFASLATSERVFMAEVGTISDLAADELAGLDGQDPEAMSQEDKVRQVQLRNLDAYLQSARVAIDDARRALRQLDGSKSHSRATVALAQLKRAREQLLDPISALKGIAQDQNSLLSHTAARSALRQNKLAMPGQEGETAAGEVPAWLSPEHLGERQADVLERSSEVLTRLQAAASAPPATPSPDQPPDPQTARMLEMAGKAVPFLESTVAAMESARDALVGDSLEPAQEQELEALRHLFRAIELFSDLKNLIELAYSEQQGVLTMLDPEAAAAVPELAEMSTAKRAQEALEATRRNVDRIERMRALIAEEKAAAQAQAQEQGEEAVASADQTYDAAEGFRASAGEKLARLQAQLEEIAAGKRLPASADSPLVGAQAAQADIEELRRIFFSVVEHLKELHRDQSNTYDRTGEAQAASDQERMELLPRVAQAQGEHAALGEALARALEGQADAASASEDPQAAQQAETLAAAAGEVREALGAMQSAAATLSDAQANSANMSVDLSPAVEKQPVALEHIRAAIEILEPPQEQGQQEPPQDQDQQEQDQQEQDQQPQEQQEVSKQQAERRLQEIREREAERQRERERGQPGGSAGVEKDW